MAKLKTGRHTSAIKAARQAVRKASNNKGVRKNIKQVTKDYAAMVLTGDTAKSTELLSKVASTLDKAAKKGVIHWKTAARRKSRMAKVANKKA